MLTLTPKYEKVCSVPIDGGVCLSLAAQPQSVDDEGVSQASFLKKLGRKARYGAYLVEKEINFATAKGITGQPVVTAEESGRVEMASIENNSYVGYLVPYNQFVRLKDYDFAIYNRNGFKSQRYPPQKVSLTDDAIFFDDNYGQFYGFHAEQSGQRSRFTYEYLYTDAKYLTRIFFHEHIPIRQSSISFKVPGWLEIEILEKNFEGYKIRKETKKEKNYTVYSFTAENLTASKAEPGALARPYYLPHLIITIRGYTVDQKKYNGFRTLDDMYAWYNFLYKKASNDINMLKPTVAQITQGKTSDEEKIRALYYWVQDNIRYIAFEEGYAGFVPHNAQDVMKNKYGDCKGMANLLTEMLKIAGYNAHFAWIGTREIPYDRTQIQSLCVDNHAITVLYHNNKTYFLDGTEKYAPLGKNAYRIQGKNVLVQDGDQYKVEHVPAADQESNRMSTVANLKLKDDKIAGHVTMSFDGHAKNFFHYVYNNIPANKRKEFIKNLIELNDNAEATNIRNSDFNNRDIPITIEADVEISNHVTRVDKKYYTSIDFFPSSFTGFVPEEDRQSPIDLDNVFMAVDEVTLELPAKAKATALPAAFKSNFQSNTIDASYSADGNRIVLRKKLELNSPVIKPAEFPTWKNFLNKIREFNRNNVTIELGN